MVLDGIETGQKIGDRFRHQFRTFDPVDIQQLIHKEGRAGLFLSRQRLFFRADSQPGRRRVRVESLACPESDFFFESRTPERSTSSMVSRAWHDRSRKFFFGRFAAFKANPQVYNQKLVYRMMVIVNGTTLLWISRVLSTTSTVYGSHKPVGWSCMCLVAKLDKNRGCAKNPSSSHFVPVDIHTLIHSPTPPC